MLIEATGSDKVRKMVVDRLKPTQHFMSSGAAKLMTDFIEIQNRQRATAVEEVSGEFNRLTVRMKSSEGRIDQSIHKIEEVLQSMKIVAMNARIEAARAGESGKAFEVVVQAMQSTLESIENVLRDITVASETSKATMGELIGTERKLKASLKTG
jgi:methyl-accepting chemotaxis protein